MKTISGHTKMRKIYRQEKLTTAKIDRAARYCGKGPKALCTPEYFAKRLECGNSALPLF